MSKTSVRKDIEKSVEEADNRDIFEKALEYGVPIVGGAALGRALMRKGIPKHLKQLRIDYGRDGAMIGALGGTAVGAQVDIGRRLEKERNNRRKN